MSLGQAERLSVFVQRHKPNVNCIDVEGKPPFNAQCLSDLSRMPASDNERIFGQKDTPNIDVALPIRYADYKRLSCPGFVTCHCC